LFKTPVVNSIAAASNPVVPEQCYSSLDLIYMGLSFLLALARFTLPEGEPLMCGNGIHPGIGY
jgi:hypothetical protein